VSLLFACASNPREQDAPYPYPPAHPAEVAEGTTVEVDAHSDLATLLAIAQAENPGLQAAFHRWRAARERVQQAGALPNPRLTFAGYLQEVETRTGPMQGRVGLQQPVPWFGERGAAADRASAEAEAAREGLEALRLVLVHRVRESWYELAWLERAIAITRGHRELLVHWEGVSRARFETGIGSHADVIRAQVELGGLENRLRSLEDLRRPVAARLNAALDRPTGAMLPTPALAADPPADPPLGALLDEDALLAGLHDTNPSLRAGRLRVEAAEHGIELSRKAFYPDLLVGAEYTFIGSRSGASGSGDDALALTLGFDLPVWVSANRAGLRGAKADHAAAERGLRQAANDVATALELALYRLRDADRRVGLYQGSLIPKGEESVETLSTAYQSGDKGFLDLVDAERVLLEFQLQAARARADRAQALSETESITGVPLHGDLR